MGSINHPGASPDERNVAIKQFPSVTEQQRSKGGARAESRKGGNQIKNRGKDERLQRRGVSPGRSVVAAPEESSNASAPARREKGLIASNRSR